MKVVIYVTPEIVRSSKPGSSSDENTIDKPFRTVISRGRASIGRNIIIAVRTFGGRPDFDADLSLSLGGNGCNADGSNCG
jgi:hypothetical protein